MDLADHIARDGDIDLVAADADALDYATTWGRIWIEANVPVRR